MSDQLNPDQAAAYISVDTLHRVMAMALDAVDSNRPDIARTLLAAGLAQSPINRLRDVVPARWRDGSRRRAGRLLGRALDARQVDDFTLLRDRLHR